MRIGQNEIFRNFSRRARVYAEAAEDFRVSAFEMGSVVHHLLDDLDKKKFPVNGARKDQYHVIYEVLRSLPEKSSPVLPLLQLAYLAAHASFSGPQSVTILEAACKNPEFLRTSTIFPQLKAKDAKMLKEELGRFGITAKLPERDRHGNMSVSAA